MVAASLIVATPNGRSRLEALAITLRLTVWGG